MLGISWYSTVFTAIYILLILFLQYLDYCTFLLSFDTKYESSNFVFNIVLGAWDPLNLEYYLV